MASHLFSQIPAQVLNKVNIYKFSDENDVAPKKKVKFAEKEHIKHASIHEESSTDVDDEINVDDDEPTSSVKATPEKEVVIKKQYSDAKVGTDKPSCRSIETQTDESLITRPLSMTEDDMHRMNMHSFSPITPIPRSRAGRQPPLRIGLTLRGKKRKVFYPNEDEDEDNDGQKANGA